MTTVEHHQAGTERGVVDRVPTDLYLDGAWRPSSDGARIDVQDPATAETIASVASATVDDGLAAVAAAHEALGPWGDTAPRQRAEILRKAFEIMTARSDEIAELIVRENGKTFADAEGETAYSAEFFRWYAEEAVRSLGTITTAPGGDKKILVMHQPVGVAVLVTPWNFPAAMATRKIAPALAAGCTVILKPASETPLTALLVAQILEDAGVPPGVVNVLPSKHSGAIVSAMLHDPRVRKISFTGSTEVGRILLREAADNVVNASMELGGNAPFIVFDDADLDAAIEGAMVAKMRNGGEACTAANRFYVQRGIAEDFTARLVDRMTALKVAGGLEPDAELGPLVSAQGRERCEGPRRRRRERRCDGGDRWRRIGRCWSLLSGYRPHRCAAGVGDPPTGNLRTGRPDRRLRRRGRSDQVGQRHRVRSRRLPVHV